jgi:DNA polymerase
VIAFIDGRRGMVTAHPSSILRMPDERSRHAAFAALVEDLKGAVGQAAA